MTDSSSQAAGPQERVGFKEARDWLLHKEVDARGAALDHRIRAEMVSNGAHLSDGLTQDDHEAFERVWTYEADACAVLLAALPKAEP
jgi:hypothetical protein